MKRVHIIHDPYKLDESTVADVKNPLEYLKSEFKDGFPEHAKIYKGTIAVENDITEKIKYFSKNNFKKTELTVFYK